jgi:hypothetical protein
MAQGGLLATIVELMVEYGVVSMEVVIGHEPRDLSNHAKYRYVSHRLANHGGFAATKLDTQAAFRHRYTSDRLHI